jgi:folate-dependent phosphoribosylglycinamide formyltransferase PurN
MKIGILTKPVISEINYKVINTILKDDNLQISLAIIDCRPKLSFRKKILKNLKKGRGGYILIMFFYKLFLKKEKNYTTEDICKLKGIDIIETSSPYSSETTSGIREHGLDVLLLINGYGIIKKELLDITPLGILSYHHGNMRKYRGMPPAFWELYNNEKEIGITVQKLETGLDSGIPIEEKTIRINNGDTLNSLTERIYCEGIDMMHKALIKLSSPEYKPDKIKVFGNLYTLPNLRQWLILKSKLIVRRINKV